MTRLERLVARWLMRRGWVAFKPRFERNEDPRPLFRELERSVKERLRREVEGD